MLRGLGEECGLKVENGSEESLQNWIPNGAIGVLLCFGDVGTKASGHRMSRVELVGVVRGVTT